MPRSPASPASAAAQWDSAANTTASTPVLYDGEVLEIIRREFLYNAGRGEERTHLTLAAIAPQSHPDFTVLLDELAGSPTWI